MAKTKVVIGYSKRYGFRRTCIVPSLSDPDDFDSVRVPMHVATILKMGEGALVGTLSDYRLYGPDVMLARYLGRQPSSPRCAVIDHTGRVISIVGGDPTIGDYDPNNRVFRLHRDPNSKAVVGQLAVNLGLLAT